MSQWKNFRAPASEASTASAVSGPLDLPPDAAFDRMRGHAFVESRLLIDVAADVLAHRLRLDRPPPGQPPTSPSPPDR
jgi:hypothetical protein